MVRAGPPGGSAGGGEKEEKDTDSNGTESQDNRRTRSGRRGGHARAPPGEEQAREEREEPGVSVGDPERVTVDPKEPGQVRSGKTQSTRNGGQGAGDAFQEAKDATRSDVASGPGTAPSKTDEQPPVPEGSGAAPTNTGSGSEAPMGGTPNDPYGLEDNSASRYQSQAQELEQQLVSSNPDITADDIQVELEGDHLVTKFSGDADATWNEIQRRAQERIDTGLEGLGVEGTRDTGYRGPTSGEQTYVEREREADSRRLDKMGAGADSLAATGGTDAAADAQAKALEQAEERIQKGLEGLGFEGTEETGYRAPKAGPLKHERTERATSPQLTGAHVPGSGVIDNPAPGLEVREPGSIGAVERAGDADYSRITDALGLTEPGASDPVEDAIDNAQAGISDVGHEVGLFVAGLSRNPTGAETSADNDGLNGALDVDDTIAAFEDGGVSGLVDFVQDQGQQKIDAPGKGGEFAYGIGRSPVDLAGGLVGLGKLSLEAGEAAGFVTKQSLQGQGGEAWGTVADVGVDTAGQIYQSAKENPYVTGGQVLGSLGTSAATFKVANAVGPRAGLGARVAIQPGEELLGYGGNRLVSRAAGKGAAEKLFPNNEPLIFSEEAAIRGGKRGVARLQQALDADSLKAFRRSTRAQGDLSGLFKGGESDIVEIEDIEAIAEVEDAAQQRIDQLRLKTNVNLEKRRALDPDPEPPEGRTLSEKEYQTLTPQEYETVSDGPDLSRSGPTERQRAAYRSQVTDTGDPFELSPREKQLAAQLTTPQTDLRVRAAEMGGAEARIEAVQEPQVRVDDQFSGTATKEIAISGIDEQFAQDTMFGLDTEFAQIGATDAQLDSDVGLGVDSRADVATDSDVDIRSETDLVSDTDLELEQGIEPVLETEWEQEPPYETEQEPPYEWEQEPPYETEQEPPYEWEQEPPYEWEPQVPNDDGDALSDWGRMRGSSEFDWETGFLDIGEGELTSLIDGPNGDSVPDWDKIEDDLSR